MGLRIQEGESDAAERNCLPELKQFETAVAESKAVMTRHLAYLDNLVRGTGLLGRYHTMVRAGLRTPEPNHYDATRTSVEAAIHPNYHEEIHYAALSLNGLGATWYGDCHLQLKDDTIQERSSVFEENPFRLAERLSIPLGGKIPSGYRAVWDERQLLAIAKLHSKITPKIASTRFADILLDNAGAATDFIEVHIFGSLHLRSFECVIAKTPKNKADKIILRSLCLKLRKFGIDTKEM